MDDNQLLASQAHHLLFLALICSIWSDLGTFGGGQSAWGGGSFSRCQPVLRTLITKQLILCEWHIKENLNYTFSDKLAWAERVNCMMVLQHLSLSQFFWKL